MIQTNRHAGVDPLFSALQTLIARHGAARVLATALRALVASRPAPRRADADARALSAHLRRDIGLPPVERPPPRGQLPL